MKTISIGDLHGRNDWKKINPEDYDLIIFLGDYLDSYEIGDKQILDNLDQIIALKKSQPKKVELLLGNHEISYLYRQYRASGYRYTLADEACYLLNRHAALFQVAFQYRNYLWTHAGIEADYYRIKIFPFTEKADENLAASLERLYQERYPPLFEVGHERGGGEKHSIGGPLWLHSTKLIQNPLQGFHQVVGHSSVKTVQHFKPFKDDPDTSVTLCDCIEWGDGSFYPLDIETD